MTEPDQTTRLLPKAVEASRERRDDPQRIEDAGKSAQFEQRAGQYAELARECTEEAGMVSAGGECAAG
jgi:hypothetical protein